MAKPEQVARFGSMMLAEQYSGDKIGKTLADALALLKSQGLHQTLLRALMKQTRRWLRDPQTRALLEQNLHEWAARIESQAPSAWEKIKASLKGSLVDRVDGAKWPPALDWADDYLAAALQTLSTVCAKMWMSKSTASAKLCVICACGTSGSKRASASLRIPARCSKAWRGCGRAYKRGRRPMCSKRIRSGSCSSNFPIP